MSTIENDRLLQRWPEAVQHHTRSDLALQEFKWARWLLPELNCFFNEVRDLKWEGRPLPWSFTLGVAEAIFVDRRLPYSDGRIKGEALRRACEIMNTGIPPHPQSLPSRTGICSAVSVWERDFVDSRRSEVRTEIERGKLALVMTESHELRIVRDYNYWRTTIDLLDCTPTTIEPTYLRPDCLAAIQYRVFERPPELAMRIPAEEMQPIDVSKEITP